jgi:hypothetical protein
VVSLHVHAAQVYGRMVNGFERCSAALELLHRKLWHRPRTASTQSALPSPPRSVRSPKSAALVMALIPNLSCLILVHDGHNGRMERLKWPRDLPISIRTQTDQTHCSGLLLVLPLVAVFGS